MGQRDTRGAGSLSSHLVSPPLPPLEVVPGPCLASPSTLATADALCVVVQLGHIARVAVAPPPGWQ